MSKIAGDINREMLGYAEKNTGDCYGDGTVYRGERSADSAVKTYTLQELAHAKGVPSMVTSAMLAIGEDCVRANEKLHALECLAKRMALDLECLTLDPTTITTTTTTITTTATTSTTTTTTTTTNACSS